MPTQHAVPLEAKIRLFQDNSGRETELLGFAELVIDRRFVIKNIKVWKGKPKDGKPDGLFVSFPSRKGTGELQDRYFDIAHPITPEAHREAHEVILGAYQQAATVRPS